MGNKSCFDFFNKQVDHIPDIFSIGAGLIINGVDNIRFGEFTQASTSINDGVVIIDGVVIYDGEESQSVRRYGIIELLLWN